LVQKQTDAIAKSDDDSRIDKLKRNKKLIIAGVLVCNFGILAWFKHLNAWINYINAALGITGISFSIDNVSLILPLGISFYTFQSMGYLIDVYRTGIKPDRNIFKFALFVSFFPQLIQGPISRYSQLSKQLFEKHSFNIIRVKHGIMLILWGVFKKFVIADRIAIIIADIMTLGDPRGMYVVVLSFAYVFQLYADFSGGVDIARGAAQIFGIILPQNFLRPYFAKTMPEYWRRWHVTLNGWWRDYIFYTVSFSALFKKVARYFRSKGMNKTAKLLPVYTGTMIVRVVNALWHGASMKFLANGFYNGLVIILGMQFHPAFMKLAKLLHINTESKIFKLYQIIRTFCLVTFARLLTRGTRFLMSVSMIASIGDTFRPDTGNSYKILFNGDLTGLTYGKIVWILLFLCIIVWFIAEVLNEKGIIVREWLENRLFVVQWVLILMLIAAIAIFGVYGPDYSASTFIYQQF